ncbi:olfactory receptor 7E178-like [Manis javanica]|uniref:olfactory receptor 7E178-like n=1 Tax=Manis javanica TaxID=9974 RepID=UPI003C6D21C4
MTQLRYSTDQGVPRQVTLVILDIQSHSRVISYVGCLILLSFLNLFGSSACVVLTVMACDGFVAICHPLHHPAIMSPCLCSLLVLLSLSISLLDSQLHFLVVSQLTFCMIVKIPRFFCDPPHLLKQGCDDISTDNIFIHFVDAVLGGVPISGILDSYYKSVSSILKIPSTRGMPKAFPTCGSHLSVACLFYSTDLGLYLSSSVSHAPRKGAGASVVYTVVAPMLSPFIYSLGNRDIRRAVQKLPQQNTLILILGPFFLVCGLEKIVKPNIWNWQT